MNFAELVKNPALWLSLGAIIKTVGEVFTGHLSWSSAITTLITTIATLWLTKQNTQQAEQIKVHRAELASMGRKC